MVSSPYLTTLEAAEVLRLTVTSKDPQESFLRYAKKHGLTLLKRGRILLVYRSEVLDSLKPIDGQKRRAKSIVVGKPEPAQYESH
jgi:hypothetical protein